MRKHKIIIIFLALLLGNQIINLNFSSNTLTKKNDIGVPMQNGTKTPNNPIIGLNSDSEWTPSLILI